MPCALSLDICKAQSPTTPAAYVHVQSMVLAHFKARQDSCPVMLLMPAETQLHALQVTTLLSKAEEATAEAPVSESEIADLEKQVSEQGTVVSQIKEVWLHPSTFICLLHGQHYPF